MLSEGSRAPRTGYPQHSDPVTRTCEATTQRISAMQDSRAFIETFIGVRPPCAMCDMLNFLFQKYSFSCEHMSTKFRVAHQPWYQSCLPNISQHYWRHSLYQLLLLLFLKSFVFAFGISSLQKSVLL